MYLSFEQVAVTSSVKTAADLTIPANAVGAEIQADTQNVRYTMDNSTDPSVSSGMILYSTDPQPKQFLIEDVRRIRFIRGGGSDGNINVHYFSGRNV